MFGNMNDIDYGGMVGVDTECYAAQGVHWMVEGNMDGVGRLGEAIVSNFG